MVFILNLSETTMRTISLLLLFITINSLAQAQCTEWQWPEDAELKDQAMSQNALYTDAVKVKNYKAAQVPHNWLLQHNPQLNSSIYINGVKIYNDLIQNEAGNARKSVLIDSLMLIYDMRMEYCDNEKEVMPRKAYDAYRWMVNDTSNYEKILELFDEAFELNQDGLPDYMMMPYIDIARRNVKAKHISDEDMQERTGKVLQLIDQSLAHETDQAKIDKLNEIKGNLQGMTNPDDPIDCNFAKEKLEPEFRGNPTDVTLAKRIFAIMLKAKCTDDPLWLETGELIAETEPDYGLLKNLGVKAQAARDFDKAEDFYDRAMEFADTNEKKADMYGLQGSLLSMTGKYSAARKMYYKALEINPSDKSPYSAIGYLYFNSFNTCAGKRNIVKDRAVFLAAYDKFIQGGNSSMAAQAKAQFPSTTEIFEQNMTKGQKIRAGCWIGETSTLRSRD